VLNGLQALNKNLYFIFQGIKFKRTSQNDKKDIQQLIFSVKILKLTDQNGGL